MEDPPGVFLGLQFPYGYEKKIRDDSGAERNFFGD